MYKEALRHFKTAFILLTLFTLLTGLVYPFLITGIAQLFFPWRANGSLIEQTGKIIGSELIGQSFTDPKYFWGRPSATSPFPYNGASSSGSNFGPLNPTFISLVKERVENLKKVDKENAQKIPIDLVTASASGLDPEISPLAAFYQVSRIAKARNIPESAIKELIEQHIKKRTFYVLGEPRINVLNLNIALDNLRVKNA